MNLEKMQMNDVAQILLDIARRTESHGDARMLTGIAARIMRRKPVRKAESVSRRCTAELRGEIREFAMNNPNMSYAEVARRFDVNPGRVSEAMAGFRVKG